MPISNSQQVDIFSDDQRQLHYAELCNALYERELASLSQQKTLKRSTLQMMYIRKIDGQSKMEQSKCLSEWSTLFPKREQGHQ